MAFCDFRPVRITDDAAGSVYIIGETFAVYSFSSERPLIYSWDMVRLAEVGRGGIVIQTDGRRFALPKALFRAMDEWLRAIDIIECRHREYGFKYAHERRMFPLKSMYIECPPEKDAYIAEGELDENDTANAFIAQLNFKLVKFLWLIAVLIMLVVFGMLHFFIGITRGNLLYFIPISVAAGGIVTLLVYIIFHAVARARYSSLAAGEPAANEKITFVIGRNGFAACESCNYDEQDLVPWNEVDYFVETDKLFVIYKDGAAVAYIPKKAFGKKYASGAADIIALKLEQK